MKKEILILSIICISTFCFAQKNIREDNKKTYESYTASPESAENWRSSSSYGNGISQPIFRNKSNNQVSNKVAGPITQEVKRNIGMVVGIFMTAIAGVIYVKTTKAAGAIQ